MRTIFFILPLVFILSGCGMGIKRVGNNYSVNMMGDSDQFVGIDNSFKYVKKQYIPQLNKRGDMFVSESSETIFIVHGFGVKGVVPMLNGLLLKDDVNDKIAVLKNDNLLLMINWKVFSRKYFDGNDGWANIYTCFMKQIPSMLPYDSWSGQLNEQNRSFLNSFESLSDFAVFEKKNRFNF
jgi:hypothetical protein